MFKIKLETTELYRSRPQVGLKFYFHPDRDLRIIVRIDYSAVYCNHVVNPTGEENWHMCNTSDWQDLINEGEITFP